MRTAALLCTLTGAALLAAGCAGAAGDQAKADRKQPRRPHVVLLIMDELTGDSLLGRGGRIDAQRYPSFALLAERGDWFRNAWSMYDSTTKATPLILDGRRPRRGMSAYPRDHPETIYDVFGRRGYRIVSSEEATAVCPRRWCPRARARRPSVLRNLNRGRRARFERFVRRIRPGRPSLYVKHVLLPHAPFVYLPSGARTRRGPRDPVTGMNGVAGFHDRFLTDHNHQRHLLQLGFLDRMLGKLIGRLERKRMFDDTLIVVTADHGFAWTHGLPTRRRVEYSPEELASVPLFVKRPGQRRGRVLDALASTLDVTPTIAGVTGFRLPYPAQGRSAYSRAVRRRRAIVPITRDFTRVIRMSKRRFSARRRAVVRRALRKYGAGRSGFFDGIGPNRELVGRLVSTLRVTPSGAPSARVRRAGALREVRRRSGIVPTQVVGDIQGAAGARRDVAVAVNGRIEAVGRSFRLKGRRGEHFAVMVPETSLREGRNTVEVLEVARDGSLRRLGRV